MRELDDRQKEKAIAQGGSDIIRVRRRAQSAKWWRMGTSEGNTEAHTPASRGS